MPERALIRAANATAAEADRLSASFARQLSKVLRDADRQLRDWLQGQKPHPSDREQIRRIVKRAGFDDLAVAATSEPFDQMVARVMAARTAAGVPIQASHMVAARTAAWRQWHLADVLDEASLLTRSLGDAVMRGGRRRQLSEEIAKILNIAEARTQTLYDTAVSIYGRQVEAEQAGDDPSTTFVYMGPVDAKTRDFCLRHVGKVYTRAEIDQLDNGQLSNVFLTGGGYNCRHVFQEISKFSELYQSREADEIREAVADVRKAA